MTKQIEITIPVYNEEETLQLKVREVFNYLNNCNLIDRISLCIADNGSTDKTLELANDLKADFNNDLRILSVGSKGVGLALKQAWASSDSDIVGYMDLDLATKLSHIKDICNLFDNQNPEFIYGSRLSRGSVVLNRSFKREVISRVFNLILRLYFFINIKDGMCGFKFFKRKHLASFMNNGAVSDGWFFCSEILIISDKLGLNPKELAVHWTDDFNSKVQVTNLTIEYLKAMANLKKRIKKI